jgi:hypothetical protein
MKIAVVTRLSAKGNMNIKTSQILKRLLRNLIRFSKKRAKDAFFNDWHGDFKKIF